MYLQHNEGFSLSHGSGKFINLTLPCQPYFVQTFPNSYPVVLLKVLNTVTPPSSQCDTNFKDVSTVEMLIFSSEQKSQRKKLSWRQITFLLRKRTQCLYVPLKTILSRNRFKPYCFFPCEFFLTVVHKDFYSDSYQF